MAGHRFRFGDDLFEVAVPADLEQRLLDSVGCSAGEMRRLLAGFCLASDVAKGLAPLLTEPPSRSDLAVMIEAEGVGKVRRQLGAIYATAGNPKPNKAKAEKGVGDAGGVADAAA